MTEKNYYDRMVYNANLKPFRPSSTCIYGVHMEKVLSRLADILGETYYEFRFVYYEHRLRIPLPKFEITGKDVILIMIGDEKSSVPLELCDQFFAIIKTYYPLETNVRNIIAFPIGYSNSATLTSFIPFEERKYDATFAGNFLGNRLDFYRQFTWLRYLPPFQIGNKRLRTLYFKILVKLKIFRPRLFKDNFGKSICYWSGGFAKGLTREEYAEIISESKIALCPKGFISTECFRLMETMRLGCVIVSDELPPSRWYEHSPIVVTKDWLHIEDFVKDLLKDPKRLAEIHRDTLNWWETVCSDEATAKYLAEEILRLKREQP